jgi:hypothetical protein
MAQTTPPPNTFKPIVEDNCEDLVLARCLTAQERAQLLAIEVERENKEFFAGLASPSSQDTRNVVCWTCQIKRSRNTMSRIKVRLPLEGGITLRRYYCSDLCETFGAKSMEQLYQLCEKEDEPIRLEKLNRASTT